MRRLLDGLKDRRRRQLLRFVRTRTGPQKPRTVVDGRSVLGFCSNDYLGLASHPDVVSAFKRGADTYGVGAGAAHLINGHTRAHHALEEELAAFARRERALLFSTGYMANLGVTTTLAGRRDRILADRLNHASLVDAGQLSGARIVRYRHANVDHLRHRIGENAEANRLIMTDGVFSMDGDVAPLPEIQATARTHGLWLLVDDAHGIGVLGPSGRGSTEQLRLAGDPKLVLMGTLGKAIGASGAFVAGSAPLIESLTQQARTYVFTTAMPPAVAEAARVGLRLVDEEPWRRTVLNDRISRYRAGARELGLPTLESDTPIQPLMVHDTERALSISHALWQHGLWVTAIRPPTVPPGTARLRITFSALHTETDVDLLLDALQATLRRFPIRAEPTSSRHP